MIDNIKIIIASDHGGFNLKNKLYEYLKAQGYQIDDIGTNSSDSCDYPYYAKEVAKKIQNNEYSRGILICSTGLGMQICANRFKNIRAVCVSDCFSAKMARQHNNSNILTLGEKVVGFGLACNIVDIWLKEIFMGERHQRRIDMIDENIPENNNNIAHQEVKESENAIYPFL